MGARISLRLLNVFHDSVERFLNRYGEFANSTIDKKANVRVSNASSVFSNINCLRARARTIDLHESSRCLQTLGFIIGITTGKLSDTRKFICNQTSHQLSFRTNSSKLQRLRITCFDLPAVVPIEFSIDKDVK